MSTFETINLSISPNYIDWGTWEAVRELMQNCKDSHDKGNKGYVRYETTTRKLSIVNEGAKLERSTLLMGGSTKRDDDTQIGCHGEGYKVALTALMRLGKPVYIHNDDELWVPSIRHDDTFNADVVTITISEAPRTTGSIHVVVEDIEEDEMMEIINRVLFLGYGLDQGDGTMYYDIVDSYPLTVYSNDVGTILATTGDLYVRGLYVGKLPHKDWPLGFNFNDLKLNRDRDVPDYNDISNKISALFSAMGDEALEWWPLEDLLDGGVLTKLFYDAYSCSLSDIYGKAFRKDHGDKAVPYLHGYQKEELEGVGLVPIQASPDAYYFLLRSLPSTCDAIAKAGSSYKPTDISEFNHTALDVALGVVSDTYGTVPRVFIVDFVSPSVHVKSVGEDLYVSTDVASDVAKSIVALVKHLDYDADLRLTLVAKMLSKALGHCNV